jgi:hypothetical protein
MGPQAIENFDSGRPDILYFCTEKEGQMCETVEKLSFALFARTDRGSGRAEGFYARVRVQDAGFMKGKKTIRLVDRV